MRNLAAGVTFLYDSATDLKCYVFRLFAIHISETSISRPHAIIGKRRQRSISVVHAPILTTRRKYDDSTSRQALPRPRHYQ